MGKNPTLGGTDLAGNLAADTIRRSQEAWEKNLAQREEFLRTVLDSLTEGLLITDRESRIIYCNRRFTEITGYSKDEILGRVSYELLTPPEIWPRMRRRLKERLSGRTETYEHHLIRKDGARHWVQVRATPYVDQWGEIAGTIGALSCIEDRKALERANEWLQDELREQTGPAGMVGHSAALKKVLEQIAVVAKTEAGVLILGESGTGKELVARAIHEMSRRKGKPLVRVNCASIPKDLFESEFFGHVRGAFTGAIKDRTGRFELADGGTLLLDEVGEIPPDLQSKLLRVLQEGQFERLGEERTRTVDVRVLAATNRDLHAEAKAGRFRLDLYYRLSVFPIEIPPLRERPEDIAPLAAHFMKQSAARLGLPLPELEPEHLRDLAAYDWPGNVRELQNVIERAVILSRTGPLQFDLGGTAADPRRADPSVPATPRHADVPLSLGQLKKQEQEIVEAALVRTRGKIYGPDGAAALLRVKPTTLASKIQRMKIKRPGEPPPAAG